MADYDFDRMYSYVPQKRLIHTMGTEKSCIVLAQRHYPSLDINTVRCAAILHDITKYYTLEEHLCVCAKFGVVPDEASAKSAKLMHPISGSLLAAKYGAPAEACDAIRWHTTGKANMNAFEKTLMFADYIEPSRDYDGVEAIRDRYFGFLSLNDPYSLEKALVFALNATIMEVIEREDTIHPQSINARNDLIDKYMHNKDAARKEATNG
ncbi:MAG TPA: bis(5'-nucleosyl)-tetraphosphatase (symmetrical) YqeK [Bacillota bacterium]|nr:bis(5'-nucleosyl)-tetraphosphatase (symmetrical) YqeK [Bacillota bacterium]